MAEELFKNVTKVAAPEVTEVKTIVTPVTAPDPVKPPVPPVEEPKEEEEVVQQPTELDMLKKRAVMMGINYSNNIGIDALKEKIRATMEGDKPEEKAEPKQEDGSLNALTGTETKPQKKLSLRQYLRKEKLKLIRVRITNLDPKKKDLPGEFFTVANEHLGTVRRYIPFGEVTDNGWHMEQCLYDMLKERTFVSIKTRKNSKGQEYAEYQNAREFALEVLPQLTPDELAKIAASQAINGGL